MVSIRGYSAYVPLYRIERASIAEQYGDYEPSGEIAVPAHDENVLTMATKTARDALSHAGKPDVIDAIFTATTSDPFDERGLAAHVAAAVDTNESVRVADFQGSPRATTNAFQAARDAIDAGRADSVLVVATDVLTADKGSSAEQTSGAGAGAVVLGSDGEVATVTGSNSRTTGFIGRFKPAEETPVESDERFNRRHGYTETVSSLIDSIDIDAESEVSLAMPAYSPKWPSRVLKDVEFDSKLRSTFDEVGYAGAAGVLLDLALGLDNADPGETLLLVSYGPGGGDAFSLETGSGVDRDRDTTVQEYVESKEFVPYAKHRRYRAWNRS